MDVLRMRLYSPWNLRSKGMPRMSPRPRIFYPAGACAVYKMWFFLTPVKIPILISCTDHAMLRNSTLRQRLLCQSNRRDESKPDSSLLLYRCIDSALTRCIRNTPCAVILFRHTFFLLIIKRFPSALFNFI